MVLLTRARSAWLVWLAHKAQVLALVDRNHLSASLVTIANRRLTKALCIRDSTPALVAPTPRQTHSHNSLSALIVRQATIALKAPTGCVTVHQDSSVRPTQKTI